MRKIAVLDKTTIDKIAAGEVVERPASVVKELVENAIDAGATAITVEITEGGKKLIRITDNGSGISAEEVPTAFLRHATSKIEKIEDLETIASLGFRGEALSSIAAVSQVELITKTPSALSGIRYLIEGGIEHSVEELGAPEGTTFLVRNLFFNTPARSKFLNSAVTEGNYVSTLMEQLALSHPEISFKYIQNKQIRLHTSGNYNRKDVIYQIYGRDIAKSLLEVHDENDFMKVEGFVGKPEISRGNRSFENYYINGRYVKNKIVTKAIEDAYKGFLMQHKFPFVSLYMEMAGNALDVNVHPAKMEVRFSRAVEVYDAVYDMVRRALTGREMIPEASVGREEKPVPEKKEMPARKEIPEPFERVRRNEGNQVRETASLYQALKPESGRKAEPERKQESERKPEPKPERKPEPESERKPEPERKQEPEQITGPERKQESELKPESKIKPQPEWNPQSERNQRSEWEQEPEQKPLLEVSAEPEKEEQLTLFQEELLTPEARLRHRMIGQLFDTYFLVEFGDEFYIIDQHAAHEKINYERLLKSFHEQTRDSQILSPPMIVTLNLREESILKENMEFFRSFGFEIEHFGGKEYCIRAVPTTLYGMKEEELFLDMLDQLSEDGNRNTLELFASRLAAMSCKAAVKGNHRLSVEEANRLIDELLTLEDPYHCPHGRPTIISMSRYDIDKKFHRII